MATSKLHRMLAAWHLRVEAELNSVLATLSSAGADPRVLAKPDFLGVDAATEARVRVLVRRGSMRRSEEALRNDGWREESRTRRRGLLTRDGVLLELTDSDAAERAALSYPWSASIAALRDYLAVSVGWPRARSTEFDGLALRVPRGVFDPAPSTAKLGRALIDALGPAMGPLIVDVGTGAGALALALAARRSHASVIGTDSSLRAVLTARRNARHLGLRNVRFIQGALLDGLPRPWLGRVNGIAANLPYVPPLFRHYNDLAGIGWRGPTATVEGPDADGLGHVRSLIAAGSTWLAPNGVLGLEMESWQVERIADDLARAGLRLIRNDPGVVIASRS